MPSVVPLSGSTPTNGIGRNGAVAGSSQRDKNPGVGTGFNTPVGSPAGTSAAGFAFGSSGHDGPAQSAAPRLAINSSALRTLISALPISCGHSHRSALFGCYQ